MLLVNAVTGKFAAILPIEQQSDSQQGALKLPTGRYLLFD